LLPLALITFFITHSALTRACRRRPFSCNIGAAAAAAAVNLLRPADNLVNEAYRSQP